MPRSPRLVLSLALVAILGALLVAHDADAAKHRRRRASVPAKPRIPTWVAPFKVITSGDGRFTAANYNMRQEGWGAIMLFQEGHLIRVWTGERAVAWEPGTTRLLITEARPGVKAKWSLIDPAKGGDSPEMKDLERTPVSASPTATFRAWLPDGRMVMGEGVDAMARDTVSVPAAH